MSSKYSSSRSDGSNDNSDDYVPNDIPYTRKGNYKRGGYGGDRSGDSRSDTDSRKSHHASCHRCGNIRKKYLYCDNCPQVFCMKCMDKMIEEHGKDCFSQGCPVCKKLCCCSEKSMNCNRKYHCYKKCLTTKKGIKRAVPVHNVSPPTSPRQKIDHSPVAVTSSSSSTQMQADAAALASLRPSLYSRGMSSLLNTSGQLNYASNRNTMSMVGLSSSAMSSSPFPPVEYSPFFTPFNNTNSQTSTSATQIPPLSSHPLQSSSSSALSTTTSPFSNSHPVGNQPVRNGSNGSNPSSNYNNGNSYSLASLVQAAEGMSTTTASNHYSMGKTRMIGGEVKEDSNNSDNNNNNNNNINGNNDESNNNNNNNMNNNMISPTTSRRPGLKERELSMFPAPLLRSISSLPNPFNSNSNSNSNSNAMSNSTALTSTNNITTSTSPTAATATSQTTFASSLPSIVQGEFPDREPFITLDSLRPGVSSSMGSGGGFMPYTEGLSLMRSNSSEHRPVPDPYSVIPRDSLSNHLIWDPMLVQLQRAPDSIQLYNTPVYDSSPSSIPPRLASMKAAEPLFRQPSLLKQSSLTLPYSPVPSPLAVDTGAPVAGTSVPKATLVRAGSSSSVPAAVTEAMMATLARQDSNGLATGVGMGGRMSGNSEVCLTSEICFSDDKKDDMQNELVRNGNPTSSMNGSINIGMDMLNELMRERDDMGKVERGKDNLPMINMNGISSEVVGISPEGMSSPSHNNPLGNNELLQPVAGQSNQTQSSETELVHIG